MKSNDCHISRVKGPATFACSTCNTVEKSCCWISYKIKSFLILGL